MSRGRIFLAGVFLILQGALPAQEKPVKITGSFSTGFYSSYTRGGGNEDQSIHFVPAGGQFDINGYYLTRDLVDYWIQPEFNAGPQASDAGFQGGNGIRTRVALLRRRAFPVTFRYANTEMKDVYFGSLSQVSSYTQQNRNKDLGLTFELKRPGLPNTTFDLGTSSVHSKSDLAMIPDYRSDSNHLNLDSSYKHWGWDFTGSASEQNQTSLLFTPTSDGPNTSLLKQKVTQARSSAGRQYLRDSDISIDAGYQSTSNLLLNQPIDLSTRYVNASLRMFQQRRWKTSFRAGYTSNIAGLLLTRYVAGLTGNGTIAPSESVLVPFSNTTSYLNFNGLTALTLSHGFGLYGNVDRTAVLTASNRNLNSQYITAAGGVTYSGRFRWGAFSGQYGRGFGFGAITAQNGKIEAQNYVATMQPGNMERLRFDLSVRGIDQRVLNERPEEEHSLAWDANVEIVLLRSLRSRIGGGRQQSKLTTTGNDFRTEGYTAHMDIEHPRFQLGGSLNSTVGNTLQAYGQLFSGVGVAGALLSPLQLIPSDLRGFTLTLRLNPWRRLELTGLWTRSVQHLEGIVSNDFEIVDIRLTYHFRKLEIIAGYFRSSQIFASFLAAYPETRRARVYVRITRSAVLL